MKVKNSVTLGLVPVLLVFLVFKSRSVDASGAYLTPGLPVCYLDESQYQGVPNMYTKCDSRCNDEYLYCSVDHECCQHAGCPACCPKRTYLYRGEIAGIVLACVAFVAIVIISGMALSAKFFSRKTL